jgi:hypothetical protein
MKKNAKKSTQKFPAEVFETLGVVLFDQTVINYLIKQ